MSVEKIDKVLKRAFENLGMEKRLKEGRVLGAWDKLVGEQIARHAQPLGIKRKKLFVQVDNSNWVYQLTLHHKIDILDKLNQEAEEPLIRDIHFKLGKLGRE
ncbi:MAG: DUF721 domain-containing protein [Candidatus Ratteibacteria bacterium]|nr:DUF721 domain-containing protein [Candidatus Ratteibacteria bacterium]